MEYNVNNFPLSPVPAQQPARGGDYPKLWDEEALFKIPTVTPATDISFDFEIPEGIRPVYLEGLPHNGKATRFFAWVGVPSSPDGKAVPGIVLVHGGGGTAFSLWAGEWYNRGYAVIAMDTVCHRPITPFEGTNCRVKLDGAGDVEMNLETDADTPMDNWVAYAVATVIKSHSYLRSLPGVDAEHIGITGISWGGFLTNITSAVDKRFKVAVPVYGCGYLGESSETVKNAPRRWLDLFDPCMFLNSVSCAILFVNSPKDHAYFWPQWLRSSMLPMHSQRSCRKDLHHSHESGRTKEVEITIDAYCKNTPALPEILSESCANGMLSADYRAFAPVEKATIVWTADDSTVPNTDRKWQEDDAELTETTARATIPAAARAAYLCIHDARGALVSTCGFGWE